MRFIIFLMIISCSFSIAAMDLSCVKEKSEAIQKSVSLRECQICYKQKKSFVECPGCNKEDMCLDCSHALKANDNGNLLCPFCRAIIASDTSTNEDEMSEDNTVITDFLVDRGAQVSVSTEEERMSCDIVRHILMAYGLICMPCIVMCYHYGL